MTRTVGLAHGFLSVSVSAGGGGVEMSFVSHPHVLREASERKAQGSLSEFPPTGTGIVAAIERISRPDRQQTGSPTVEDFSLVREHRYAGEGRGLAWDGRLLYVTGKLWRSVYGLELRR